MSHGLKNRLIFCGLSMLAVFLVSCSLDSAPTSQIDPTSTLVLLPSTTPSPYLTSTVTPVPTLTLPPATLSVVSTMDAIVAQKPELGEYYHYYLECVYLPYACVTSGLGLSPNGLWAVFFNGSSIKIISVDNTKEWEVSFSELSGTQGAGTVSVAHWSKDGRFLYVFPRQDGADGGYEWFWGWIGTRLVRLDLETGTWIDTGMGYAFSFSPDDRYLAYRAEQGIHIHDLITGQEEVVKVNYAEYGRFTWSPDSQQIVFVTILNENDLENRENGFTALLLDVDELTTQTIFENNTEFLYPVEWIDLNHVVFEKILVGYGERYVLDLNTGVITSTTSP
jgi:hypothetical protein